MLVPTDFSEASEAVIRWLPRLGRYGLREVVLVHVIDRERFEHPASGYDVTGLLKEAERLAKDKLAEYVSMLEASGLKASYVEPVPLGSPELEIVRTADKVDPSMIVMSSRGRGWLKEVLFGSVTEGVVRRSRVPVFVVKVKVGLRKGSKVLELPVEDPFSKVLVATDFSQQSELAYELAKFAAKAAGGELLLVHVIEHSELVRSYRRLIERELVGMVRELSADGLRSRYVVRVGVPYKEIIKVAREEGVTSIFMGFRGSEGFLEELLMGSTVDAVLRYSMVPVMVCKRG